MHCVEIINIEDISMASERYHQEYNNMSLYDVQCVQLRERTFEN